MFSIGVVEWGVWARITERGEVQDINLMNQFTYFSSYYYLIFKNSGREIVRFVILFSESKDGWKIQDKKKKGSFL